MRLSIRRALAGAFAVLLASCGGGSPSTDESSAQQPKASAASVAKSAKASVATQNGAAARADKVYIVQLKEAPVATYTGGVRGMAATRPARGSKIDSDNADVARYRGHLESRHAAVSRAAGTKVLRSYAFVFNGFAARMTEAQAQKLAASADVLSVTEDERRFADTSSTPAFLGLSGKEGFWRENEAKGENIIIGIIDSGIWPEHPSFSDKRRNGRDDDEYERIRGWKGICQTGEQFAATDCNRKLIGARYYFDGLGGPDAIKAASPSEILSARDFDGHGTHTASTAGGNEGVQATGPAAAFGKISGIAPRARIAAYKALWFDDAAGTAQGATSDLVAAIDDAVADGVDVINYSISGTSRNFLDPAELAFLRAADAGVFVAASAGNSGPTASTVAHPSPWITTVAAGTHNRDTIGTATLGDGTVVTGVSVSATAVASAGLINAVDAAAAGASATAARLCFTADDNGGTPALDPAKVAGKIVVCDRGTSARVDKSKAVLDAGGVGVLLVNLTPNSLNADFHSVPTVHLQNTSAAAVHAYAAQAGATASIAAATISLTAPAPFTASFSSRGPLIAGAGNLLKPDLSAPGQDILAAFAPPTNGRLFDILSGTSMSSPHVAGLAALLKEVHPRWSPMAIKSALMTSAGDVLDGPNTSPAVIFSQGAGHVRPNSAVDPGLVFDSGFEDWVGFLCGTQLDPANCTSNGIPVLNPSDLNVPSIAIGALAGTQTVTRRVTNVGESTATYTPAVSGMAGFTVKVSPASLTLARGQTKSFTVTFTRADAALASYTGGQLTLSGGSSKKKPARYAVRIPMVAKPVALAAPQEVSASFDVKFGYAGPFTATARGLVEAAKTPGSVATDKFVDIPVTIPAGTTYARFSLFDSDVNVQSDLDLEVRNAAGNLVGSSGGPSADEEVNLVNPAAGTYTVRVIGFATGTGAANFTLFNWALGSTPAGNMTVTAPATATVGATGSIGLSFTGLTAGVRYLGAVVFGGDPSLPAPTIVRVDP